MEDRIHCVVVEAPEEWAEPLGAVLFEAGATGIEEQEAGDRVVLVVYAKDARSAERLLRAAEPGFARARRLAGPRAIEAQVMTLPGHDWQNAWTRSLVPERLTEWFVAVPESDAGDMTLDARHIVLEPTLAFGFGEHATTRLAARAVEWFVTARPGASVLDVGTGSGVLAIVAARCGASRVVGTERDPVALEAARRNVMRNGVSVCTLSAEPVGALTGTFELVVANLDLPTLLDLAEDLARRVARGGRLIVTGLLAEQASPVADRLGSSGWGEAARLTEDDWVLVELVHREAAEAPGSK